MAQSKSRGSSIDGVGFTQRSFVVEDGRARVEVV